MELKFILEQEDVQAFNKHYFRKKTSFIQKHLKWLLFAVYLIYMLSTLKRPVSEEILDWGNWVILLLSIGVFSMIGVRSKRLTKRNVTKMVKEYPNMVGERQVAFLDDVIIYITERSKTEFKYTSFLNYEETAEYFVLYLTKQNAIIIPKRAFDNNEHIDALARMFKERMQQIPSSQVS